MLKKLMLTGLLGASLLSGVCFGANEVLLYGDTDKGDYSKVLDKFRNAEIDAIQTTLKHPVKVKEFSNYVQEIQAIKQDPKLLAFVYAKSIVITDIARMNQWVKVAQVIAKDPISKQMSSTYSAYLITTKDSKIANLNDLTGKKIAYVNPESMSNYLAIKKLIDKNNINVDWIKVDSMEQAYAMVKEGKVDAVGTWHNYYKAHGDNDSFKVIHKIEGLNNPVLYANTQILSAQDVLKVKKALQAIKVENFVYR